jgi:ankyrin repeat protein
MSLHEVAKDGDENMVPILLQAKGINPNTPDQDGRTPLSHAASRGQKKAVQLLLQAKGTNPNAQDKDGWTPLSYAASQGHEKVVQLLLQAKGINPNTLDKDGRTPLSHAASRGSEKAVQLLLQAKGTNPNTLDKDGRTPLSHAASRGSEKAVQLLLQAKGINPNAEDKNGWPPLLFAAEQGSKEVVRMLADSTCYHNRTTMSWAAEHGHITAVKLLQRIGHTNPSSTDYGGRTPLYRALENGHGKVVEFLASVDTTTIHTLIQEDQRNQIQHLLKFKNVINSKDMHGQTPLHTAIRYSQIGIVEDLITHGADTNSERSDGVTPLRLAIQQKDVHSIEILLRSGVQVRGVLIKDWLEAYGRDAQRVKVELSEAPGNAKCLRFNEPKLVDLLAGFGTSRHLLSLYPCSGSEAESSAQSLFTGCPEVMKHLKSNSTVTSTFRMFSKENRINEHTLICLGVRYPSGRSTFKTKHFETSWDICVIAWTIIPPTKATDGPNWNSVAHISMLPYGWIPNDGADFLQQFILYLKERWLKLCDLAEEHMSSQVRYTRLIRVRGPSGH